VEHVESCGLLEQIDMVAG